MKQAIQQGCVGQIFSQSQQFKRLINKQDLLKVSSEKTRKKLLMPKAKVNHYVDLFLYE